MATAIISPAERVALEKAGQYAGSRTGWTPENAPEYGLDPEKGFIARGTPIAPSQPPPPPAQPSPLPEPTPRKPDTEPKAEPVLVGAPPQLGGPIPGSAGEPPFPQKPWKQWTPLDAGAKPVAQAKPGPEKPWTPADAGAKPVVQAKPGPETPADADAKPVAQAKPGPEKPWTPADAGAKPVQAQQGQPQPQLAATPMPSGTGAGAPQGTPGALMPPPVAITPMPSGTGAGAPQGPPADPHGQINALIAQGKSPGEAQAIVAGQQPKTLGGKTPQPKPTPAPKTGQPALNAAQAEQKAYNALSDSDKILYSSGKNKVEMFGETPTSAEQAVIDGVKTSAAQLASGNAPSTAAAPTTQPQQPAGTLLRATWFGRNPDASVDTTDEATMSYYNAHHGAWGADLLDKGLVGIALSPSALQAHGIDIRKSPSSQGFKARVTAPDGKSEIVDIVDLGPKHTVDMTYGLGKKLGLNDNSQLQVSIIGPDGKEVALNDKGGKTPFVRTKGGLGGGEGGGVFGGGAGGAGGVAQIPSVGGRPPPPEEAEANPPRGGGGAGYGQGAYQGGAPRDWSFGLPPWVMGAASEEPTPTRTLAKIPQEPPTEDITGSAMKQANVLGVKTVGMPEFAPPPAPAPLLEQLAASGVTKALPAPPAAPTPAPAIDPSVVLGLMKRGFTREQALAAAAKATVSKPGAAAIMGGASFRAPPAAPSAKPPAPPPAKAPPSPPPQPQVATRIGPRGSTVGVPNPPGSEAITKWPRLTQQAQQHAAILSPDDPRVKKQRDGMIKGEHFVEGDPFHEQLLSGLPYGKQGRQRQILGHGERAIADKQPMHISYISAPAEAALHPTRESRTIQYEEHSPEARLMGTTEGQLVGHSMIPVSVGVSPSKKGSEPHQSYIQGISTNVLANNFHHINAKLADMGRSTPYAQLGHKFSNDLEGYLSNLNAGHTGTGRGHAVGTAEYPNVPDENHVPYHLTRREADFINTVINNTAAFAKHEDGQALRRLAEANGTLITPEGETNRMRHEIEQHEPGWRQKVLEPSIRTFKTGLIHEVHPSEEHMPATIRPGKEYQDLTKAIARTSQRGRPDVPLSVSPRSQPTVSVPRDLAHNQLINRIERDFSEDRITEEEARSRLHAIGENPDEYRFVGGSGGLISPYEENPEAITPEEHSQLKDNLRKQWIGGKMNVDDYRRKVAEVPLPEKPSKPAAASPAAPAEPTEAPAPKLPPIKKPKPQPVPEPAEPEEPEEAPTPKPKPAPKAPPEPPAYKEPPPDPNAPTPAVKMGEQIFTAPSHYEAWHKAGKPRGRAQRPSEPEGTGAYTYGFQHPGGEFTLTRKKPEAPSASQEPPEAPSAQRAAKPASEEEEPEKIKAAAFRFPSGNIYEGPYHSAAYFEGVDAGEPELAAQHHEVANGYTTTKGRFVGRDEGWRLAQEASQLRSGAKPSKSYGGLAAESVKGLGFDKPKPPQPGVAPGPPPAPTGEVSPAPEQPLPAAKQKPKKAAKSKEQTELEAEDFRQAAIDRDNISPEDAGKLARIQKIANGWIKKNPILHGLSMHAYLTGQKEFPGKLNKEQIGEHFDATNPKLDYSKEEHRQKAADAVVHDIMHSLAGTTTGKPSTAYGWYDRTVRKTMAKIGQIAPKILTDPDHAMAFKLALAITSQGQDVFPNAESAWHIYQHWLKQDEMPTDRKVFGGGTKAEAMEANLGKVNELWKTHGTEGLQKILMTRMTSKKLREEYGLDSGEKAAYKVNGAMGLGPKIGAFFSNLNGDFDPTTIDLWFSRNMNLMAGNMFGFSDKATRQDRMEKGEVVKAHLSDLKDLLDSGMISNLPKERAAKMAEELGKLQGVPEGKLDRPTAKALAPEIYSWAREQHKAYQKSEGYERRYHPDLKTKDNVTAKKLDEGVTGLSDDPRTTTERDNWRDIMARADQSLKAAKVHLTNADKQALLWFDIKDLFKMAGSPQRPKADYLDAAYRLVRKVRSGELPGLPS